MFCGSFPREGVLLKQVVHAVESTVVEWSHQVCSLYMSKHFNIIDAYSLICMCSYTTRRGN